MFRKIWQKLAAPAILAAMLVTLGQPGSAAASLKCVAGDIAGIPQNKSTAVEQAVTMLQNGKYGMALATLGAEKENPSAPARARVFGAYALLVAGKTLGALNGPGA